MLSVFVSRPCLNDVYKCFVDSWKKTILERQVNFWRFVNFIIRNDSKKSTRTTEFLLKLYDIQKYDLIHYKIWYGVFFLFIPNLWRFPYLIFMKQIYHLTYDSLSNISIYLFFSSCLISCFFINDVHISELLMLFTFISKLISDIFENKRILC